MARTRLSMEAPMKMRPDLGITGPPDRPRAPTFGHIEAPLLHLAKGMAPQQFSGLQVIGRQGAIRRLPARHAPAIEKGFDMRGIGRFILGRTRGVPDLGIERVKFMARDQFVDLSDIGTVDDIGLRGGIDRAAAPFHTARGGRFRNAALERWRREFPLVAIASIISAA